MARTNNRTHHKVDVRTNRTTTKQGLEQTNKSEIHQAVKLLAEKAKTTESRNSSISKPHPIGIKKPAQKKPAREQMRELNNRISECSRKLDDLGKSIEEARTKGIKVEALIEDLQKDLDSLKGTPARNGLESSSRLASKLDGLKSQAKDLETKGNDLRNEAAKYAGEAIKMDEKAEKFRRQGKGGEAAKLEERAERLRDKALSLEKDAAELQGKGQKLDTSADKMAKTIQELGIGGPAYRQPGSPSPQPIADYPVNMQPYQPNNPAKNPAAGRPGTSDPGGSSSSGNATGGASGDFKKFKDEVKNNPRYKGMQGIDRMMDDAYEKLSSDDPSEQAKGQYLMQRANRMFDLLSTLIRTESEMQSKAIQNIR